ncbi:hypothetical protein Vadar_018849 [Vaccinium darrowii]|uniref:Uncharacterized protein n=1 Tax=Vaccinium darrowii TaxID=229202 RepID=A0ACB7Y1F8_9ERIC|nr:hypothetical protein Vadar_018849 [Vaccinium darrowii]
MSASGRGRGGRGTTSRGMTPQGATRTSVLTPAVQSTPNNPEHNSSAAPHISESVQASEPLTPEDAPVTKGCGRTKGLALAKFRGHGEKVKLGFSRTLGRPTSENNDDLTMYSTELGIIVRQFALLQEKSWEAVSQDAKEMFIAHIRGKCNKYKASRSKPRIHHVAGSQPFYKVKNDMKKKKKIVNPDLPELWKETHYSEKRNCWTDGSQTVYDKLKEVQGQSMENGFVPLTDEELSCAVLGPKPGYIRGLGHGPKPSLTKSGQPSRAQLIRDAEEAREAAAAAERKCDEALAEAAQTRKNTEQLSENMANMQSQINLLLQLNGRNMPSNDANCSTNDGDLLGDEDAMEC